jgi:uncharacterized protein (TIGR02996 family)
MNLSPDHKAILSAVLENPRNDTALLVYADWLDEHGDARSSYLRSQVEFRNSRTDELRRRLVQLYPHEHLAWTTTLEQAGAVEANLTLLPFELETGISAVRRADGTIQPFQYHDQPPLPVEAFDGNFDWLRESEPQSPYEEWPLWKSFCAEKRQQGYFVPVEFERFLSNNDLPARIRSSTDNYFLMPRDPEERRSTPLPEFEDGLFVSFYADSQYCALWGILLPREPGRYAPIIAGTPEALFPDSLSSPEDSEANNPGKPVMVASQLEQFVFRTWIENQIWFATVFDQTRRPLTPMEQVYVDHRRNSTRRRMKLAEPSVTPKRPAPEPRGVSSRTSIRTNPRPRATDDAFLDKLDGGSEVLRATRRGDIQRLKEIFALQPEAREATGHMGRRPLHVAVELERLDVVRFLINAGVDVNGTRASGDTPLFWAPNAEIAETLIRAGASLRARDGTGREPIHYVAQFSRPDVLRVLLDHGCDPNARDDSGHTPLHWVTGATAFIHICDKTDPRTLDCVELLVERGADVNARGLEGNVPLHGVAVMPNMQQRLFDGTLKFPPEMPDIVISIVRFLLQHGADPLAGNNNGVAPIDMASEETRREMEAYVGLGC